MKNLKLSVFCAVFALIGVFSFIPDMSFANAMDEEGGRRTCTVSSNPSENIRKCAPDASGDDYCHFLNSGPFCNATVIIN